MTDSSAQDSLLRCPNCAYNLTGLTDPRCPECGRPFEWDAVRRAALRSPTIAFERLHGFAKLRGFILTWLTSLFAPWRFANQIVVSVDFRHAIAFGAMCFLSTGLSFFSDCTVAFWLAWIGTASIYVAIQAIFFAIVDVAGWRHPLRSAAFWLLAGCYTSAIMITEFRHGPPLLFLQQLDEFPAFLLQPIQLVSDDFDIGYLSNPLSGTHGLIWWFQMALWLTSLAFIYAVRMRSIFKSSFGRLMLALLLAAGLFLLYATVVDYIGFHWLYDLLGGFSNELWQPGLRSLNRKASAFTQTLSATIMRPYR